MAIRTVEQYLDSLNDRRVVYADGKRVNNVTTYPKLRAALQTCTMYYILENDPRYQSKMTARTGDGNIVPFVFLPVKDASDMLRKRDTVLFLARTCLGVSAGGSFVAADVLNALTVVSQRMCKEVKTDYSERVDAYRKHLMKNDPIVVGAVTDAKGDRSLRPSEQVPHKDFYVRIIDRQRDGIVVRGAKWHIARAPLADELFVCPTRSMRQEDRNYAVSFAIPVNTRGISMVMGAREPLEEGDYDEYPLTSARATAEALVIFDDVFVPRERVFLCKEWKFAGQIAHMFGNFHRLHADTYKYAEIEIMVGAASLLAESNGVEKAEHIKDKLSWLAFYLETIGALGQAAAEHPFIDTTTGLAYPNPVYSNAAKFFFADNYHQAVKYVQDIAGGIIADVPSFKNFRRWKTRTFIEKYLQGKSEVSTENRLRTVLLARDACAAYRQAATIHAEGSLASQRMALYNSSDWERYRALARRAARIFDGPVYPLVKDLPPFPPQLSGIGCKST